MDVDVGGEVGNSPGGTPEALRWGGCHTNNSSVPR